MLGLPRHVQGEAGRPAALACYAEALRSAPGHAPAWRGMGDAHREAGEHDRAVACYKVCGPPGQLWMYYPLCEAAPCPVHCGCDLPRCPRWLPCCGGLLGAGPSQRPCTPTRRPPSCCGCAAPGPWEQEALRLQASCADAHTGLGASLRELGRRGEAEAAFEAVVALRPGCALALGNLAGMYYDQVGRLRPERRRPAPPAWGQSASLAHTVSGRLPALWAGIRPTSRPAALLPRSPPPGAPPQGKLDQAIAAYQRAIAAQPQFPEAYNNLGNALREAGRPEEAVSAYTACIQLQVGRGGAGRGRRLACSSLWTLQHGASAAACSLRRALHAARPSTRVQRELGGPLHPACPLTTHTRPSPAAALQLAAAQAPLLAGQVNFSGPTAQVRLLQGTAQAEMCSPALLCCSRDAARAAPLPQPTARLLCCAGCITSSLPAISPAPSAHRA